MSDDGSEKSKKKRVKKKDHLWQEAGEEFFQESYPSGSGQDESGAAGAGGAHAGGRNKRKARRFPSYSTRRGGGGNNTTTTITYAMSGRHGTFGRTVTTNVRDNTCGGGNGNNGGTIYDNTGILPDLTDLSIPNEQKRWEEVQKIKTLPIPMAQKRQLKTQLTTIPMLKLKGWRLLRWKQMLLCHSIGQKWKSLLGKFTFWNTSIHDIQVGRGTAFAQLFLLIKWAFKLNLIMCALILTFILLPQLLILKPISNLQPQRYQSSSSCNVNIAIMLNSTQEEIDRPEILNRSELAICCTELNFRKHSRLNYSYNNSSQKYSEVEETLLFLGGQRGQGQYGSSEYSPLFYGFYYYHHHNFEHQITNTSNSASASAYSISSDLLIQFYSKSYSFIYLTIQLVILITSFYFTFKEARLKNIIVESEDAGHKYSDLVFTGWEHYTRDNESAKVKRKTIRHEMKLALKDEKHKIEEAKRSRRDSWKLFGRRIITNTILIGFHLFVGVTLFELIGFSYSNNKDLFGSLIIMTDKDELNNNTQQFDPDHEETENETSNFWIIVVKGFLPAVTIAKINVFFPAILTQISKMERFSQSITLKLTLWRIVVSRILSILFVGVKLYLISYCKTTVTECTQCVSETWKDRSPCWESLFGEHLYKIALVDLAFKIIDGFGLNTIRNCIGLYCPGKFFKRIGLMKFNLIEQSADIIYIQFLSWIGAYFAPFLPILILIYSFLLFYLNKLTVFVTCRGIPNIYKTMRISTVYLAIKLFTFGLVGVILGIVLGYLEPSKSCGPFRQNEYPWEVFVATIYTESTGPFISTAQTYLRHPCTLLIIATVLCGATYYYLTLTKYSRGTVNLLKNMLVLEGHDKQFLFARLNSLKRSSVNSTNSLPLTRSHGTILNEDDD